MRKFYSLLISLFAGKDNRTLDIGRVLGFIITVSAIYFTWRDPNFDVEKYGIGMGTLLAAISVNLKIKETTEP